MYIYIYIYTYIESSKVWKKPEYNTLEINVIFLIYVYIDIFVDDIKVYIYIICIKCIRVYTEQTKIKKWGKIDNQS